MKALLLPLLAGMLLLVIYAYLWPFSRLVARRWVWLYTRRLSHEAQKERADDAEGFYDSWETLLFANLGLPALGEATAGGKGSGRNSASQRHNRAMGRAGAAAFHPTRTVAALARKRVVRGLACAAGARFAASGSDIAPAAHARTGGRVTQS